MEIFKIENLCFTYPKKEKKTLYDINLTINKGEFITLIGKSGCGKTTLLRLLKSEIAPIGKMEGAIYFKNKEISGYFKEIGFVMQSPENQIVTDKVWHELAFGLESLGIKKNEIRARVSEMASFFGIENWFLKDVNELSGGQKQILNLASVMVMNPEVLILDEPTSQLDPISAQEFIKTLEKINRELGITIIICEHRLEEVFSISDRIIVMDGGKVISDNSPKETGRFLKENNNDMFSALPSSMRIYGALNKGVDYPITIKEGREWIENYSPVNPDLIPEPKENISKETAINLKDVWFRYEKDSKDIIKNLSLKVYKGEIFALMGGNGTGKTTLLSLISKINSPIRGKVLCSGMKIGLVPQNPQTLFIGNSVYDELSDVNENEEEIKKVIYLCGLENILDSHPYDLSGGEQQRTALAKILLLKPDILLLDEPTKGFDAHFKKIFSEILSDLKSKGITIFMVSHDVEFCAENADRCAIFFDGNITSIGYPKEFFSQKSFYTTASNKMARAVIPNAVTVSDVVLACGGKIEEKKDKPDKNVDMIIPPENKKSDYRKTRKIDKKTILSMLFLVFVVPATIYLGTKYFGNRKYYLISILIILETILSAFLIFERRKPKAREIVTISVMCGLAVAGRTAFYAFSQFKPVIALIIITGLAFGSETGFLVGAMTAFISNFFFGQGPWTPWQMFAFGIVGFVSGMINPNIKKIPLCIFGFLVTVLVYGGIMNPASLFMSQNVINLKMVIASYMAGFSMDIVLAVATALFLWLIKEPIIKKLERIKIKYNLNFF